MERDDRRFARPGSDSAPITGLIDPAAHRLPAEPPSPAPASAPGSPPREHPADPPSPDATLGPPPPEGFRPGEAIEFAGPRRTRREVVRLLVALPLALVLIAGGFGTALLARDSRQVLTQEQLAEAMTTFRPDTETSAVDVTSAEDLRGLGLRGDPPACQPLIYSGSPDALGGASWNSFTPDNQGVDLMAIRFADATVARRSLAMVRSALRECRQVTVLPQDADDGGYAMTVDDVDDGSFTVRDRVSYTLQIVGDGRQASFEFGAYVRRYGNVVSWSFGSAEPGETDHRAAVDDLVTRMDALAGT